MLCNYYHLFIIIIIKLAELAVAASPVSSPAPPVLQDNQPSLAAPPGIEFLSFRERAFYGIQESSNLNTHVTVPKSGILDLVVPPCSCFSFLTWKQKEE